MNKTQHTVVPAYEIFIVQAESQVSYSLKRSFKVMAAHLAVVQALHLSGSVYVCMCI